MTDHPFRPDPSNEHRCYLCGFTASSDRHDHRWVCQACENPRRVDSGWCSGCRAYTGQAYLDGRPICPCGQHLHYSNPLDEMAVQELVNRLGVVQKVEVTGLRPVWVPRHYIALHGVTGHDLSGLAARYKWKTVLSDGR